MADLKITELDANTTPIGADLLPIVDDVGGTPKTEKITLTNLGIIDGWMPASETWTYVSANTIAVPAGAASKYAVDDRIKWTQTGVRYGVIIAVADELLTIAVNTDYVVDNAAISANYYSHQANPIGYPHWFAWTAVIDWNGTDPTSGSITSAFKIEGKTCFIRLKAAYSSAGANNTQMTIVPPIAPSEIGNYSAQFNCSFSTAADGFGSTNPNRSGELFGTTPIYCYIGATIAAKVGICYGWYSI